jgi:hypothetical protein
MKIDKLESLTNLLMPDNKKPVKSGSAEFQKILNGVQAQQEAEMRKRPESATAAAGSPEGIWGSYSLPPLREIENPAESQARTVQKAERVLSILEEYQRALGDPGASLKGIHPLVQSLSSELPGMKESADRLPSNDPLKKILGEIGVVAAVEVEKFNRGEYLA